MIKLETTHNVTGARHRKMRVGCGRGSGKGKTCGRGHKGQYARSGHKHKPAFEGGQMRLIRRIPKRGFNQGDKTIFALVSIGQLSCFDAESEVTPAVLRAAGLIKGVYDGVKVLGDGELTTKLVVKAHAFSQSAQRKITAAGGTCTVIG